MNAGAPSWLFPTALVTYVALSQVFLERTGESAPPISLGQLLLLGATPLVLALVLRWLSRAHESNRLATSLRAVRLAAIGLALVAASFSGADRSVALMAFRSLGLGLAVVGTALSVAEMTAPPGVLRAHPAARSWDAVWLSLILWSAVVVVLGLRWLAPARFPLDAVTLELAPLFASLGSLLTLGAVLFRARLLRGLEIGVRDRLEAALSLALAGIIVGATAGFVKWGRPLEVVSLALAVLTGGITFCVSAPRPVAISRGVRGLAILLLLATPTLLLGVHWVQKGTLSLFSILLLFLLAGVLEGALVRRLSRPLSPAESRWLESLDAATEASLHPEPEQALSATLFALRKAEPTSKARPEMFRVDPPAVLSVDIAGYRHESPAEFPMSLARLAEGEPSATLRRQTLQAAEVRRPELRPALGWFRAHQAESVTVLREGSEPIGLLVLPQGRRTRSLTLEEVERLDTLCRRLSGLLSINSAVRRARLREEEHRGAVAEAQAQVERLRDRLGERQNRDRKEAEERIAWLRRTGHSPGAQITLQALEAPGPERRLQLSVPLGVDPVPWAAHAHLCFFSESRPLVVVDLSEPTSRDFARWSGGDELSPLRRAAEGSLVLLHPDALLPEEQGHLAQSLRELPPALLLTCASRWEGWKVSLRQAVEGPRVQLPTLAERAEDLQGLILDEVSRLGQRLCGSALGIDRAALHSLVERPYPGNEAELRGILHAVVAEHLARPTSADSASAQAPAKAKDAPQAVSQLGEAGQRPAVAARIDFDTVERALGAAGPEQEGEPRRRRRSRLAPRTRR